MSSVNIFTISRELLLLWQPCRPSGHDDQGPGHLGEHLHGLLFLVLLAQCHPLLLRRLSHWPCVWGQDGGHHLLLVCHCRTGRDQNSFTLQSLSTVDSIYIFHKYFISWIHCFVSNCKNIKLWAPNLCENVM